MSAQYLQTLEAKKKVIRDEYMRTLLNKKETAKELGNISTCTLDRMRKEGLITSKRVRGQIFFEIDEIVRFLVDET